VKIVQLNIENFMRLRAVEITPNHHVVEIGGANKAGKTSVLDAIMGALGGKKSLPAVPLRRGAKNGHVTIALDGDESKGLQPMTVTRTFTDDGRSTLEIRSADGYKAPSPQAILDELCGRIAFDPLEFTRQSPKQQVETLKALVGLDFTEADRKRATLYAERTEVNRDAKAIQARLDGAATYDDAPAKEVSVADLSAELTRRIEANRQVDNAHRALEDHVAEQSDLFRAADAVAREVARLETVLAEAVREADVASQAARDNRDALHVRRQEVETMEREDTDEIQTQIATAEETNRQVRANQAAKLLNDEYKIKATTSDGLTERIGDIDADKTRQVAAAEFPVPGLGFDENGVTLNDLPFKQASSAESLGVSAAMGFALNPTLPVMLIREGSLLDDGNLEALTQLVKQKDGQLWIERVGDGGECSVVIEDGHVRVVTPEPEPAATP